ncbi:MAG: D-Ala-D-Ala carboxypeptidase family metallohydrolase [Saprospiraceae bacterium]
MKIKKYRKLGMITLWTLSLGIYLNWYTRDIIDQILYDLLNNNEYVLEREEIDEILSNYSQLRYDELPKAYQNYGKLNEPEYQGEQKNLVYNQLKKKEVYRRIVGNIRIKDLICRDKYYKRSFLFTKAPLYWVIDNEILYKLLELQEKLSENGYDRNGFRVKEGYRHPNYNEKVGGASSSRHIRGEAVDMVIKDVNKDGRYSEKDKMIILELCEDHVIGNKGGIGKYPGTKIVHIDVRGRKARWNSY